jgi:hypothetical protein
MALYATLARVPCALQDVERAEGRASRKGRCPSKFFMAGTDVRVSNVSVTNFDDAVCVKPSAGAAPSGCTRGVLIEDVAVVYFDERRDKSTYFRDAAELLAWWRAREGRQG